MMNEDYQAAVTLEVILAASFTLCMILAIRVRVLRSRELLPRPITGDELGSCMMYPIAMVHMVLTIRHYYEYHTKTLRITGELIAEYGHHPLGNPSSRHLLSGDDRKAAINHGSNSAMTFVNIILSELTVLRRVHILWPHHPKFRLVSGNLLGGFTVASSLAVWVNGCLDMGEPYNRCIFKSSIFEILSFALLWLTHAWATLLIAMKAREHRKDLRKAVVFMRPISRSEVVLGLFAKSALMIIIFWTIILFIVIKKHLTFVYATVHREMLDWQRLYIVLSNAIAYAGPVHIAGIHPTIVIVLVARIESDNHRLLNYSDIPTPSLSQVLSPEPDSSQLAAEQLLLDGICDPLLEPYRDDPEEEEVEA